MPIPKPGINEDKNEFISRCIEQLKKEDPEKEDDVVQAICINQWEDNRN